MGFSWDWKILLSLVSKLKIMSSPTIGTTVTKFCSGASNATQATAEAAFTTALGLVAADATGRVAILSSGVTMASNSQGATFQYLYWAMVQYTSAV